MKLSDIASTETAVAFIEIGGYPDLVFELQSLMIGFGVLDPPSDGKFGPISRWALGETLKKIGMPGATLIDKRVAKALLAVDASSLFPLKPKSDFAGKIAKYMVEKNYWLSRHPACVNIIYVEGAEVNGTPNDNAPNKFNDVRLILRLNANGIPQIAEEEAWDATAAPGQFFVNHPMDPNGAAHIALGQFKAWTVGMHGTGAGRHEALVQSGAVTVYRDANRDHSRLGDLPYTGLFGINQHWGYDLPRTNIQNASAGCLVGRLKSGHRTFMKLVKGDARYIESTGYLFMSTIIERASFN